MRLSRKLIADFWSVDHDKQIDILVRMEAMDPSDDVHDVHLIGEGLRRIADNNMGAKLTLEVMDAIRKMDDVEQEQPEPEITTYVDLVEYDYVNGRFNVE